MSTVSNAVRKMRRWHAEPVVQDVYDRVLIVDDHGVTRSDTVARTEVNACKDTIRNRVWDLLDRHGADAEAGSAHGRIPNFIGADAAADRLAELQVWQDAAVVKAVPDKAQLPARARALREGKLVYMAVPKLAQPQPFYLLDPAELTVAPEEAASSRVAASIARNIGLDELRPVDLIICGSVAVNH
ncbi:5-formyltetrahydrofolate cyclo-ligase, partial [Saccharopolyspora antimicrobica]